MEARISEFPSGSGGIPSTSRRCCAFSLVLHLWRREGDDVFFVSSCEAVSSQPLRGVFLPTNINFLRATRATWRGAAAAARTVPQLWWVLHDEYMSDILLHWENLSRTCKWIFSFVLLLWTHLCFASAWSVISCALKLSEDFTTSNWSSRGFRPRIHKTEGLQRTKNPAWHFWNVIGWILQVLDVMVAFYII